jgi:hypothetical protein
MRRACVCVLVVALWQIEMAVQCGIATSQRPVAARPVAPPAPTPPDARDVIIRQQPSLPHCETGRCPPPQKSQSIPAKP